MLLRASLLLSVVFGALACGTPKAGKLAVDTPALPYKAPDIEELSGVPDEPESPPADEPKPEAKADTPPPTPVIATPTTPAKPPAKPAPKTGTPAAPAKK